MTCLAIDPGAERLGWAVMDRQGSKPNRVASGIYGLKRKQEAGKKEPYQEYRLRLINYWVQTAPMLLTQYSPSIVISEIVPAQGSKNFSIVTQASLAATAITVVQTMALFAGIPVTQIAATTVKKKIGGKGSATKIQVRNGVSGLLNEVTWERGVHDEVDSIAIGLCYLGYKI